MRCMLHTCTIHTLKLVHFGKSYESLFATWKTYTYLCCISVYAFFAVAFLTLSLSPSTSFRHRLSIKQNESLNYDFTGCCWFLFVDSSCAVCVYVVLIFITACPCAFSLSPDWCESHHSIIANKFPPVPRRRTVRMLQKKNVEQTVKTLRRGSEKSRHKSNKGVMLCVT